MNLSNLVDALRQQGSLETVTVFWSKGLNQSPFCTYLFVDRLSRFLGREIKHFSLGDLSLNDIQAQLATSFLGTARLYWVKDVDELSAADRKHLESIISAYKGPHTLLYTTDQEPSKGAHSGLRVLRFDEKITALNYPYLYELIHSSPFTPTDFSKKMFEKCKAIDVDTACMLTYYQSMLGRQAEQFLGTWLSRIVRQEYSLFELSKYFFAKDYAAFLGLWKQVFMLYPPEFWIVYWSDQLWQALSFIVCQEQKLKAPSYRLPFSFTQQGFRKYKTPELVRAHSFIYAFDYAFKHGSVTSNAGMELFCLKFLSGGFGP